MLDCLGEIKVAKTIEDAVKKVLSEDKVLGFRWRLFYCRGRSLNCKKIKKNLMI